MTSGAAPLGTPGTDFYYGHDDFSIGLLRDTTPHVECYDVEQSIHLCGIPRLLLPATATKKDAVRSTNHHNNQHEA